jgi:hypothetical protein
MLITFIILSCELTLNVRLVVSSIGGDSSFANILLKKTIALVVSLTKLHN